MKIIAYTDGSYINHVYGSGAILLIPNTDVHTTLSSAGDDNSIARLRNVAGELIAVMSVFNYLETLGSNVDEVDIFYDYDGVKYWVTGEWRTNKEFTMFYKEVMQEHAKNYKINFHKVKAHTGIYYNELADKAAKAAIKNFTRGGK